MGRGDDKVVANQQSHCCSTASWAVVLPAKPPPMLNCFFFNLAEFRFCWRKSGFFAFCPGRFPATQRVPVKSSPQPECWWAETGDAPVGTLPH